MTRACVEGGLPRSQRLSRAARERQVSYLLVISAGPASRIQTIDVDDIACRQQRLLPRVGAGSGSVGLL